MGFNWIKKIVSQQFRKPQGLLGLWAERTMAKRNPPFFDQVIQLLDVNNTDRILEIGFGAGLAIKKIFNQNESCSVTGIDFSALMHRKAQRNNAVAYQRGQLQLLHGDVRDYDFQGNRFTKIFCINVVYFWEDLHTVFGKIFQLLDSPGRMVLFMSSAERLNSVPLAMDGIFHKYPVEKVMTAFEQAGFIGVQKHIVDNKGMEMYCICAQKGKK